MLPLSVGVRRLGELLSYVFFGLFGRKEIEECLKMRRH